MEPIDALLFAAIMYEIGRAIESRRRPVKEKSVFSYRFSPLPDGSLFAKGNPWADFWEASSDLGAPSGSIAVVDITDFYNQVYHHVIENQLVESGVAKSHVTAVMNLLNAYTDRVSRGIPIGPHAAHLLAEGSLVPLDEFISLKGYKFCRFVDDIHIACPSAETAQVAIQEIANFLDRSQKLLLNKQKTEVLSKAKHEERCEMMRMDNPINEDEREILAVIKKNASPYSRIGIGTLTPSEIKTLRAADIEGILHSYMITNPINYVRLRWLMRRLAQIGVPTGVDFTLTNLKRMYPALGDVASYLSSATAEYTGKWETAGETLLWALKEPIVSTSDYLQMVLLSLFARITPLDHFEKLVQLFDTSQGTARREILLAAAVHSTAGPWLTTLKATFGLMDTWQRRAFLQAVRQLPKDERRFWIKGVSATLTPLEKEIAKEAANF